MYFTQIDKVIMQIKFRISALQKIAVYVYVGAGWWNSNRWSSVSESIAMTLSHADTGSQS
jgi:hypothetical protein